MLVSCLERQKAYGYYKKVFIIYTTSKYCVDVAYLSEVRFPMSALE